MALRLAILRDIDQVLRACLPVPDDFINTTEPKLATGCMHPLPALVVANAEEVQRGAFEPIKVMCSICKTVLHHEAVAIRMDEARRNV